MGFSKQEYCSGLPGPPPEDLSDPGIKPASPMAPALQADSLPMSHRGSSYSPWLGPKFSANSHCFLFWFLCMDNNLGAFLGVKPCPSDSSSCPPTHNPPFQHLCLAHGILQLFPRLNEKSIWLLIFFFILNLRAIKKHFSIIKAAFAISVLVFAGGYIIIQ